MPFKTTTPSAFTIPSISQAKSATTTLLWSHCPLIIKALKLASIWLVLWATLLSFGSWWEEQVVWPECALPRAIPYFKLQSIPSLKPLNLEASTSKDQQAPPTSILLFSTNGTMSRLCIRSLLKLSICTMMGIWNWLWPANPLSIKSETWISVEEMWPSRESVL